MSPGGFAIPPLLNAYRGGAGRSHVAAAATAMITSLFLAACGGNADGSAGASRSPASAVVTSVTPTTAPAPIAITVRSPAFAAGAPIPARFTCKGSNTPPPLTWTGLQAGAVASPW